MTREHVHRAEWLLMYRQGLEPADIARACHTLPRTAAAYLREQVDKDPTLIDRRLCWCREPSLPVFRPDNATAGWEGNALSLARFVGAQARLPRRAADTSTVEGALEVFLYHWVRAQRLVSAEGELSSRRENDSKPFPDGWPWDENSCTPGTGMNDWAPASTSTTGTVAPPNTATGPQPLNAAWAPGYPDKGPANAAAHYPRPGPLP